MKLEEQLVLSFVGLVISWLITVEFINLMFPHERIKYIPKSPDPITEERLIPMQRYSPKQFEEYIKNLPNKFI